MILAGFCPHETYGILRSCHDTRVVSQSCNPEYREEKKIVQVLRHDHQESMKDLVPETEKHQMVLPIFYQFLKLLRGIYGKIL